MKKFFVICTTSPIVLSIVLSLYITIGSDKSISFWEKSIFVDESKYNVFGSDGKEKIWRKPGTALNKENLQPSITGGGESVIVWGCMNIRGTGNLQIIEGIMDKFVYLNILQNNLKLSAEKLRIVEDYNFYQDNDPKHKSHLIQQWLIYNVPHVIATPVQSPDLNPIEYLWEGLNRKIITKSISNRGELKTVLKFEWEQISSEITMNLVQLMSRRLQAVVQAKSYSTKY
ncbi:Transposable element Tc1 transposase [Anthophora quadrimaculata]